MLACKRRHLRQLHPNSDKLTRIIDAAQSGAMAHSGCSDIANLSRVGAGRRKETHMRKTPTVLLAAATIAVSLATFATDASAQRRGGAVAAGVAAGLVGG